MSRLLAPFVLLPFFDVFVLAFLAGGIFQLRFFQVMNRGPQEFIQNSGFRQHIHAGLAMLVENDT